MVPQKRYRPHTSRDRRHYLEELNLEPCINFYMQKTDELMFKEHGSSILVHFLWPGYRPWSRQIPTRDCRNQAGLVTRAKLAKNVAESVARFITKHRRRQMEEDGDPAWAVGPRKTDVFDLVLVRLDNVSKGS
ncbi:hypothetical protein F5148DRAFT_164768 [Russula earlei]|uniref:Uncharacterized protein n=1 Tax=Russula earlei TaxID=71964 RepID=A0ACC0TQE4_9AGAM|nr:hypothetical protein F5148DRAFT_164768 [Russula earlei]